MIMVERLGPTSFYLTGMLIDGVGEIKILALQQNPTKRSLVNSKRWKMVHLVILLLR